MNKETVRVTFNEFGLSDCDNPNTTTLTLPVIEMEQDEYNRTLQSKWFSDEFYETLSTHRFSILLKNINTGEKTALQTFGTRFPLMALSVS